MSTTPHRDIELIEVSGGGQIPKRKIVKPHYKEKWEVAEGKISILWRVIIGLIIISLALGSLAVVVMLNLK